MGLNERLAKLEERRAPPPHRTPPIVSLLLKSMDAQRRELDGRPPDPANEPTPEEARADREGSRWFVETGAALLRATTTDPDGLEGIAQIEDDSTGPA